MQDRIDGLLALSAARGAAYAEENPAAATGMLVKDYRGKDANQVVWRFDSALESKIMEALKRAAIEGSRSGEFSISKTEQSALTSRLKIGVGALGPLFPASESGTIGAGIGPYQS